MTYKLGSRIENSSVLVYEDQELQLRLSNNALAPWFLILPKTQVIEWYELEDSLQQRVNHISNQLAKFLKEQLLVDKVDVATIGNVVSQMHIHVVDRKQDDFCWPDVILGKVLF